MSAWDPEEHGLVGENTVSTVFLVGTGASEGAWPPIAKAIKTIFQTADDAEAVQSWGNFVMAKLVAVHRAQSTLQRHCQGSSPSLHDDLARLKKEIATQLQDATKEESLRLRQEFVDIVNRPEWGDRQILTTNWDLTVERGLPGSTVRHIHGSVLDPGTLYLPSDYAYDPSHSKIAAQGMLKAQHECIEALWGATTVVLYGLSLDPLDGELAAICATGFQPKVSAEEKLERVVIYNLKEQEKLLSHRVRWLLPAKSSSKIEFRAV